MSTGFETETYSLPDDVLDGLLSGSIDVRSAPELADHPMVDFLIEARHHDFVDRPQPDVALRRFFESQTVDVPATPIELASTAAVIGGPPPMPEVASAMAAAPAGGRPPMPEVASAMAAAPASGPPPMPEVASAVATPSDDDPWLLTTPMADGPSPAIERAVDHRPAGSEFLARGPIALDGPAAPAPPIPPADVAPGGPPRRALGEAVPPGEWAFTRPPAEPYQRSLAGQIAEMLRPSPSRLLVGASLVLVAVILGQLLGVYDLLGRSDRTVTDIGPGVVPDATTTVTTVGEFTTTTFPPITSDIEIPDAPATPPPTQAAPAPAPTAPPSTEEETTTSSEESTTSSIDETTTSSVPEPTVTSTTIDPSTSTSVSTPPTSDDTTTTIEDTTTTAETEPPSSITITLPDPGDPPDADNP